MMDFLLADGQGLNWRDGDLWYALPLIIAVSLVYAATRHERMRPILLHAGRVALWIAGFMAVVFVALGLLSWRI
jgi:hypothetical protein